MKKKWNGRPVTVNSGEQPSKKPKNEQPADEKEKYADYEGDPYTHFGTPTEKGR